MECCWSGEIRDFPPDTRQQVGLLTDTLCPLPPSLGRRPSLDVMPRTPPGSASLLKGAVGVSYIYSLLGSLSRRCLIHGERSRPPTGTYCARAMRRGGGMHRRTRTEPRPLGPQVHTTSLHSQPCSGRWPCAPCARGDAPPPTHW